MNQTLFNLLIATTSVIATTAFAQVHDSVPSQGPHGGTLRQTNAVQVETVVETGGLKLFVYDRAGQAISAAQGRGVVSLRVRGGTKSYRYDLLPDGSGVLTAAVDLSKIAGRQIELDFQLVGIAAADSPRVAFSETAAVPASGAQLAAAAIARQRVCPVSSKPLGSMGEPIPVAVQGQTVFVCCAGCVAAVQANPAKYASGRPEVRVAEVTAADASLIAKQAKCPVMDEPLGSMGGPIKVMVGDKPIFLCCKGCIKKVQAEPAKYMTMVDGQASAERSPPLTVQAGEQVRPGVFKATVADARFVAAQKRCPVMDEPLDAMGGPFRVNADGRAIYICCPGCAKPIAAEPQKYLAILSEQGIDAPVLR